MSTRDACYSHASYCIAAQIAASGETEAAWAERQARLAERDAAARAAERAEIDAKAAVWRERKAAKLAARAAGTI